MRPLMILACLALGACAFEPHKTGMIEPGKVNAAERDEKTRLDAELLNKTHQEANPTMSSPTAKP